MSPLERVLEFIGGWSLGKLLGFVMLPLDEGWVRGEKNADGKWYSIKAPSDETRGIRWYTMLVHFARQDSEGKWINYYNKPGETEYLCED